MTMTLDQARSQNIAPWDDELERHTGLRIFRDRYPVALGHLLFVPESDEPALITYCFDMALLRGRSLVNQGFCDGFNVGINMGKSAGQTVMYPHVHLIPRRTGDTQDPTGGVRGVISSQANYRSSEYVLP
jgi:diadenosine tetraphosphate (Ap4A) HIT family hydrolase